jgi:hypothetical protein
MDSGMTELASLAGAHTACVISLATTLSHRGLLSPRHARALILAIANSTDHPDGKRFAKMQAARIIRNVPISARTRRPLGRPLR